MKIELVKYSEDFLDYSWTWLNDPEIKDMTNTTSFSKETQKEWFNTLQNRNDYIIWGIEADNIPIGACGLKNITNLDCEYWGYIGVKSFWGKGIGRIVMNLLIEYARNNDIKSIWLTVLPDNERAQKLYFKLGFKVEPNEISDLIQMRLVL